jgi:hypothetical protein
MQGQHRRWWSEGSKSTDATFYMASRADTTVAIISGESADGLFVGVLHVPVVQRVCMPSSF